MDCSDGQIYLSLVVTYEFVKTHRIIYYIGWLYKLYINCISIKSFKKYYDSIPLYIMEDLFFEITKKCRPPLILSCMIVTQLPPRRSIP